MRYGEKEVIKSKMPLPYETYPFHLHSNRKKKKIISKCINNLSTIFCSFVAPESLIFMAGCDIICLTGRQKIRELSGWHASKSTSFLLNKRPSYNNWKYFLFLLYCFISVYLLIQTDVRWKGEKNISLHRIQVVELFVLRLHSWVM